MKIAILGYSGSGKSTLGRKMGQAWNLSVLHLDGVQFRPGWHSRPVPVQQFMTETFLDCHKNWVIDGNYPYLSWERRMEEADRIVLLSFSRLSCLMRALDRYYRYRHTTRPDVGQDCPEQFDWEFARWILWEGRRKNTRKRFRQVAQRYPQKTVILKNQRQLSRYLRAHHLPAGKG